MARFEISDQAALANLGMFIVEETEKWAKVVKFSGARPE